MQHSLSISSFKLIIKRAVPIAISVAIILCFMSFYNRITFTGSTASEFYYDYDRDSVDIAIFGSSHVYHGVNPVVLWDDYGYRAVDFATGSQPIWGSLTYLKEVLKKQSPKLVILDIFTLGGASEEVNEKATLGTYVGFKPSLVKLKDMSRATAQMKDKEFSWDHFWVFPSNHEKYDLLRIHNYMREPQYHSDSYLGYNYHSEFYPMDYKFFDSSKVTQCEPISEFKEQNLREFIECCLDNNIELLLTNTFTTNIWNDSQTRFNYVKQIADEYGIEFVNGCDYPYEIGINPKRDFFDDEGHLSHEGAEKYTKWLAKNYISKYNVPSRTIDDPKSKIWTITSNAQKEHIMGDYIDSIMDSVENLDALMMKIREFDGFSYILIDNREHENKITVWDKDAVMEYDNSDDFKLIKYYGKRNLMLKSKEDGLHVIIDKDDELVVGKNQVGLVLYSENRARFQFVDLLEVQSK